MASALSAHAFFQKLSNMAKRWSRSSADMRMPRWRSWRYSTYLAHSLCTTLVRSRQSMQLVRISPDCSSAGEAAGLPASIMK